jgi:DNA polymerase-3 subunit epsilon
VNPAARPAAPHRRARRAPWRSTELVALDFEATGLDFQRDTIISFGAVPILQGRIDIGACHYQLVDPGEVGPSRESIVVHGLRPLDLEGAPSLESAKEALGSVIAGRFLVTWWAPVEAGFLDNLFGGGVRSWMRRAVDVRDLMIALEGSEANSITLTQAADRNGVPVTNPHHALDDALVTAQLFLVMAAKLAAQATTVAGLRRLGPLPLTPSSPVRSRPQPQRPPG